MSNDVKFYLNEMIVALGETVPPAYLVEKHFGISPPSSSFSSFGLSI